MGSLSLSPQQAAVELLRRRRARRSLPEFAQAIEVPGRPLSADPDEWLFAPIETGLAAHHLLFMQTLDDLHQGKYHNCMIFAPPGSAKSSYGSVVFPAYIMGAQKQARVIMGSYASDIALKQSRRTRQIVRSAAYQPIFDCGLIKGNESVESWSLSNGSEYMAGGILSGMTGNRATCFIGETLIKTKAGAVRIDSITVNTEVLSYDHRTGRCVWAAVQAIKRSQRSGIVRVRTTGGREFDCTDDHLIYVDGKGYTQAQLLIGGDSLIVEGVPTVQRSEACGVKDLSAVLRQGAAGVHQPPMRLLCEAGDASGLGVGKAGKEWHQGGLLQQVMPDNAVQLVAAKEAQSREKTEKAVLASSSGQGVPGLWCSLPATQQPDGLLFACVCRPDAQCAHDGPRQQQIQGREKLRALVSFDASVNSGQGRRVCGVQDSGAIEGASPRRTSAEQHGRESGCAVCQASPSTPQRDAVAVVERLCGKPQWVYDIQVEGCSNFFANEVLAHNCLIIDDPVQGREQADSATIRKKTREAYEDDLSTRLMPGAKTLIIQTRWHEDDLSGGLLPKGWDGESGLMRGRDGQDWFVLSLPAIADRKDDPLGRKIGEALWPEWFTGEHFQKYKANNRTWSALFQQKPTPEDGDYFRREMFRYYGTRPKHLRIYGASDFAVTSNGGDYTVHGVFGVDPVGNIYVLDWWRGQTAADVWIDELLGLADKWQTVKWFGEAGTIRRSIEPYLRKRQQERGKYISVEWLASVADKPTRARSIQGRIAQGMVYFPEGVPWAEEVISQCLRFPNTSQDDDVDVLSLLGRGLDSMVNALPPAAAKPPLPQPGTMAWVLARTKDEKPQSKYR